MEQFGQYCSAARVVTDGAFPQDGSSTKLLHSSPQNSGGDFLSYTLKFETQNPVSNKISSEIPHSLSFIQQQIYSIHDSQPHRWFSSTLLLVFFSSIA